MMRDLPKSNIGIIKMRSDVIIIVVILLLVLLMAVVTLREGGQQTAPPGQAAPVKGTVQAAPVKGTVQATPTVDPTMTALQKEQLNQQIKQLQTQNDRSITTLLWNSLATVGTVVAALVALFGVLWTIASNAQKERDDRQEAKDKDLKDNAEERFKTAVTALGDKNVGTQVGGAILLQSFCDKSYEQYHIQIFDLAVAYLRLPRTPDTDKPQTDPNAALPLTSLSQALITVFTEAFPLARRKAWREGRAKLPRSFDARYINLDKAFLCKADLEQVWLAWASLREIDLDRATLCGAWLWRSDLRGANLSGADLRRVDLGQAWLNDAKLGGAKLYGATLWGANLSGAELNGADLSIAYDSEVKRFPSDSRQGMREVTLLLADLSNAHLRGAWLQGADLRGADLSNADLHGAHLSGANLSGADLRGADLSNADLRRARLMGLQISGVDLLKNKLPGAKPPEASQDELKDKLTAVEAEVSQVKLFEVEIPKDMLTGVEGSQDMLAEVGRSLCYWEALRLWANCIQDGDLQEATDPKADRLPADLRGANLSGADLRGADLRGAVLSEPTKGGKAKYNTKDNILIQKQDADTKQSVSDRQCPTTLRQATWSHTLWPPQFELEKHLTELQRCDDPFILDIKTHSPLSPSNEG